MVQRLPPARRRTKREIAALGRPGLIQDVVAAGNEADFAIKPSPPRHLGGYSVPTDS